MYTSSKKPVFRCVLPREGRGHSCTCRWRCAPCSVHPIDLLHARHQVLSFNGQWSDWALHFQLQPGNGLASVRSNSSSNWRCNVECLLREEDAVICSVPDEVEGWRSAVGEVMVTRKHRAGSEGMYGFAVACIGIGVSHGDGRGVVEDVRRIAARYRDASHTGCVVKIGDGAKGSWNGGRATIRRASVVLYSTSKCNMINGKTLGRWWQCG